RGDHERTPGTVNVRAMTDFSVGPIRETGNAFDVALRNPNEFFVVNGPSGPLYTRAGNFTLNAEGSLVTPDGLPVQGDGGAITITGPNVKISESGAISVNGTQVGRMQVVRFDDT